MAKSHRFFIWLALLPAMPAADSWLRVESPHFEVISDAGERRARAAAQALEEMRQMWTLLEQPLPAGQQRMRVVLFKKPEDFRVYGQAERQKGFFLNNGDRAWIVAVEDPQTLRSLKHEFVHAAVAAEPRLPAWLNEGLAEYYSTFESRKGKGVLGAAIASHVQRLTLDSTWRLPLRFDDADEREVLERYSLAWGLVAALKHRGALRTGAARWPEAARRAASENEAFRAAFQMTREEATKEGQMLAGGNRYPVKEFSWTAPAPVLTVSSLSNFSAGLLLLELATAAGMPREASTRWEQLLTNAPPGAESAAALGFMALAREELPAAERQFRRAVELNSPSALPYFELATLLRDRRAAAAEVEALLQRAIEINPAFEPAHYLLGRIYSTQKRWAEAAASLRKAAGLAPARASYWMELADAEEMRRDYDAARGAAQRAVEAADSDDERRSAAGQLKQIEQAAAKIKSPPPAPEPRILTPQGWEPPKGDTTVEARLVFVDCNSKVLKFRFLAGKRYLTLTSERPDRLTLRGKSEARREFVCGPQRNVSVLVEYKNAPDKRQRTDGELVAIEFR